MARTWWWDSWECVVAKPRRVSWRSYGAPRLRWKTSCIQTSAAQLLHILSFMAEQRRESHCWKQFTWHLDWCFPAGMWEKFLWSDTRWAAWPHMKHFQLACMNHTLYVCKTLETNFNTILIILQCSSAQITIQIYWSTSKCLCEITKIWSIWQFLLYVWTNTTFCSVHLS